RQVQFEHSPGFLLTVICQTLEINRSILLIINNKGRTEIMVTWLPNATGINQIEILFLKKKYYITSMNGNFTNLISGRGVWFIDVDHGEMGVPKKSNFFI